MGKVFLFSLSVEDIIPETSIVDPGACKKEQE
jgi:hypothetical protein